MSIQTLAARLQYAGGDQLGRINQQKLKSLQMALKNDYNSRMIKTPVHAAWPCLINSNNLKSDYDKKYVSVEFESQLQAGDVFEILDDHTHWMVYLPVLTETAYLRAEIIRCRYEIEVNGQNYWVYFQGPTETDLRWFIKNQINVNELNLSGTIYIKNDANTKNYFKRFTRLKLDGHIWEVQVTDSISVPGILELEVQEYYDNSIEELPSITDNITDEDQIYGVTVVKPNTHVGYMVNPKNYDPKATWKVLDNPRVKIEDIYEDGRICSVYIAAGTVKPFTLQYGNLTLPIQVDWVKPVIQGPQTVYPYDTHTYWLKCGQKGEFSISADDSIARIIKTGDDFCDIEIVTGKKNKFTVSCLLEDGTETELPVQIKSF